MRSKRNRRPQEAPLAFLLAFGLAACDVSLQGRRCELSEGSVLARREALAFDAVSVTAAHDGQLAAAWSDASGVWLRRVARDDAPQAAARRVAERCAGGIDLAPSRTGGLLLGCSRPDPMGDGGRVLLYELDASGALLRSVELGSAGRDGRGVELATNGAHVEVLFQQGSLGEHAIHHAHVAGTAVRSRSLSRADRAASAPALLVHDGHLLAAWSETDLAAPGGAATSVWLVRDDGTPARIAESAVPDPAPRLAHDGSHLLVGFRDRRSQDKRAELYVAALDSGLRPVGALQRVGRANSEGSPQLATCKGLRAAVLPREYGGEHYIAVHALDPALRNLGGGHQYYANSREFVQADASCDGEELRIVIGERASPDAPGVELLALRFRCR